VYLGYRFRMLEKQPDFLWEYLKNSVYATKPADLADFIERIVHQIGFISADMRRNVLEIFICD